MTSDRESLARIGAVEEATGEGHRTLTLSTGAVLGLKRVPPMLATEIVTEALKVQPKIPVVYSAEVDRQEENPSDPAYIEAMQAWQGMVLMDINNAFILLGTEVVSVPDGMPGPTSAVFLEEMKILHRDVDGERQRYLSWVKYRAAGAPSDVAAIVREVGRMSGVAEADVSAAVRGFPSQVPGRPDNGSDAAPHSDDEGGVRADPP